MNSTKLDIATAMKDRILILDGAMGTALQDMDLSAEDFGGEDYEGCNEYLVITKPEAIAEVHRRYLEAGADIIETNTFGGTALVLDEYDLGSQAYEINLKACQIARECADAFSTPEKPRYVAGSIGPTTKSLSVTGGISFDELAQEFCDQTKALIEGQVDYLLLETALDTLNLKAGYIGILKAFEETGSELPIALSGTIETMGTMLAGQSVEALYVSCEHMNPLYIGLNCATGPAFMRDHMRSLASVSRFPVSCVPNAGIPLADGTYPEGPKDLAEVLNSFVDEGWINFLGGCCGTTPDHIREICAVTEGKKPRPLVDEVKSFVSGIDVLDINDEDGPFIVGERTNVIGSRAFKRLIEDEKFEEASEIARKQVKAGAHIIDVCLSNPDRDETSDVIEFLSKVVKMVKVPIMIDSQVPEVVEEAFKLTQGKCLLNSVNLEDGEKAFEELIPIVRRYGGSVVVGCIRGEMAVSAEEKLDVAIESHQLLTEKYGMNEEDLMFDPLVFPCGTGDENYFGSGAATIEGVRLIKEKFPRCRTTLGISNVSFGLPPAGREVLNSVFLNHCVQAGLDTAIVNSEKLVRFSQITDEEKKLCDDLLWYRTEDGDPVAKFAAYFRDKKVEDKPQVDRSKLSLDEKFEINVVQGTKEFLIENLEEARATFAPLEIINGPLMRAMDIVGKLFNDNELIVAEVLQSAEVMKTAVSYLEQFMEKTDVHLRGKIVLATVKGDVHDIGKNLVDIILSNNGYKVIDLGIKCPPDTLIQACKEHEPDMIGLSGLLVKSAQQMVITASDLKTQGISAPILVGGAALTQSFTDTKISPEYDGPVIYCKDAMTGLDVANQLTDETKKEEWVREFRSAQQERIQEALAPKAAKPKRVVKDKFRLDFSLSTAKAPDFDRHIVEGDIATIFDHMSPQMVYGTHLGLKGNIAQLLEDKDPKATKLYELVESLKKDIIAKDMIRPKAVYQYFNVVPDGQAFIVLDESKSKELTRFVFPRQSDGHELCLTDYIKPEGDTVCMFVLTCGDGISDLAKAKMDEGDYFVAHGLQSIALEAAEGFAEVLHKQIRRDWGIPDDPSLTLEDLFKLKYSGVRMSFGYPACPRLDDQAILWDLLNPTEAIGVSLSDQFMMHPEASVSAVAFHHPQARYFRISDEDLLTFESA